MWNCWSCDSFIVDFLRNCHTNVAAPVHTPNSAPEFTVSTSLCKWVGYLLLYYDKWITSPQLGVLSSFLNYYNISFLLWHCFLLLQIVLPGVYSLLGCNIFLQLHKAHHCLVFLSSFCSLLHQIFIPTGSSEPE